jgi:anhydro-N-acetylmuramic acid kinase
MNSNIEKLYALAAKPARLIIGLMSGTSFDGLDLAMCRIHGNGTATRVELLQFATVPYSPAFKEELKSVFSRRDADLEKVCLLNAWVAVQQAAIINDCIQEWKTPKSDIDLIASHGQTIYHAPRFLHGHEKFSNATLQIGDGDHIAVKTGIITISDFRQKHIAAGGEGAPLAVYGDFLIFSKPGENRIMLNIGGIANFTYLPADQDRSKVFSTDVGPGNTIMDAFMQQQYPGTYYDKDSALARQGIIDELLLAALKEHSFFGQGFPKTIGPELFNLAYLRNAQEQSQTGSLNNADIMATLNRFSADIIVQAILQTTLPSLPYSIYTSGGGLHNPLLMENIQRQLPHHSFYSTDVLDINPDAKEAVLFALLANECVAGETGNTMNSRPNIPGVTMGKISFPE